MPKKKNLLEAGDVEEALKLTFALGDHHGFTGSSQIVAVRGIQDNSDNTEAVPDISATAPTPVPPDSPPAQTGRSFSAGLFVIPFLLLIVLLIGLGVYQLLKHDDV